MGAETKRKLVPDFNEIMMDLNAENFLKPGQDNIVDFMMTYGDSRIVPLKLKPQEAQRALKCQKAMLEYAHKLYIKNIGTAKEEMMLRLYNDAKIDYQEFIKQHKNELETNI